MPSTLPYGPVYFENAWLGVFFESDVYNVEDAFKFGEAPLSKVKSLGYVQAGSGYKIEPAFTQRESRGSEKGIGQRLITGLEVITRPDPELLARFDQERAFIVIVPSTGLDFDPLHEDHFAQKTLQEWDEVQGMQLLAPQWLKVHEDIAFGDGELRMLTLTANLVGNGKGDFVRGMEFVPAGIPFEILVDTTRTAGSVTADNQLQIQAEGQYRVRGYHEGTATVFRVNGLSFTSVLTFPVAGIWALAIIPEGANPINRYSNEITPASDAPKLRGIISFGDQIQWSNFFQFARGSAFADALFLPSGAILNVGAVTNFQRAFTRRWSAAIPSGLFHYAENATTFSECFQGYRGNSIPPALFDKCPMVTDFRFCFQNPSGPSNANIGVPADLFRFNIRCRNYDSVFGGRNIPVVSLSGMYINLANTIILSRHATLSGGIRFGGGNGQYDPSYVNPALGAGNTGQCRAILAGQRSVTVSGASNADCNGLYEAISDNIYRNSAGWEFRRQQPDPSVWLLFDTAEQEQASGQAENIVGIMPHAVERLGNSWTGNESGITVALTGAGWVLTDGGPI